MIIVACWTHFENFPSDNTTLEFLCWNQSRAFEYWRVFILSRLSLENLSTRFGYERVTSHVDDCSWPRFSTKSSRWTFWVTSIAEVKYFWWVVLMRNIYFLFVCGFTSHSSFKNYSIKWRRHHYPLRGWKFWLILMQHSLPWSSEGSFACRTYCNMRHPFIMVISENPWHWHLMPNHVVNKVSP